MRPKIVGEALGAISADPEVAKAVFDVLEIESLLEGKVKVTLLPEGSDLLAQLTAVAGRSGEMQTNDAAAGRRAGATPSVPGSPRQP